MITEVKILRAGQPRPYADSVYEAEIRFNNFWDSTTGERPGEWDPGEDVVKMITKAMVHCFSDKEKPEWHEAILKKIFKVGRGFWFVRVEEPYCD
jgi:hypothetical protein